MAGLLMADNLASLFMAAKAPVVDWHGEPAYAIYEFEQSARTIRFEMSSAGPAPVQGLRLRIRNGTIEVKGVVARDMVLWADSASSTTVCLVQNQGSKRAQLKCWNVWRERDDLIQAWLGNAAMRVDELGPDHVRLRCSDGGGQSADFGRLTVDIFVIE